MKKVEAAQATEWSMRGTHEEFHVIQTIKPAAVEIAVVERVVSFDADLARGGGSCGSTFTIRRDAEFAGTVAD